MLNADQLTAVQHIVTERSDYNPPFVIYGPFGTGKTETIAQAVMVLIKERRDYKILIGAQYNRYGIREGRNQKLAQWILLLR